MVANRTSRFAYDWWIIQKRFVYLSIAIFLLFASLSGLMLWISLPKRRLLGIVALVLSVGLCSACFLWLRP